MKNQNRIVFFIGLIVLLTIVIQFYWNYIQYKNNKQQVENEIQISLDNAVDNYYTELSKKTIFGAYYQYEEQDSTLSDVFSYQSNTSRNKALVIQLKGDSLNQIDPREIKSINVNQKITVTSRSMKGDTVLQEYPKLDNRLDEISNNIREESLRSLGQVDSLDEQKRKVKSISFYQGKKAIDSMSRIAQAEQAVMKFVVSIKYDSINFEDLKTKINRELNRKNIDFDYFLVQKSTMKNSSDSLETLDSIRFPFKTVANSALLPNYSKLEMYYPNIFWITLKKGTTGILLSLILSSTVIFSLFYLLYIIRKQKQLSEIKNDFISNITHELKTPIATITSAVEGLLYFNQDNNSEKNKKYLEISTKQLDKLKILVEKILETSLLESKDLILEKENIDLILLIKNTIEKYKTNTDKTITFNSNTTEFIYNTDVFHFENAISNLIENAIKYGGNEINIRINHSEKETTIEVSDNGSGISTTHQKMIFDKFYRIPSKDKHNVKGFGIGLYYTKNIIEKHNGTIELKTNNPTTFLIYLYYE